MLSNENKLQKILQIAPEWGTVLDSLLANTNKKKTEEKEKSSGVGFYDLFEHLGAKALYAKAVSLTDADSQFTSLLRDHYYQTLFTRMLSSNQNLRRFWAKRRIAIDFQRNHIMSLAIELSQKMEGILRKHISQKSEDGFKVLLPAYVQRTVHNAAVDYIRQEWEWEKQTLQDMHLDPEQDDPRQNVPDDLVYSPENRALSNEQIIHLNRLRTQLESMLASNQFPKEPLFVIDCIFGLGLTANSEPGKELTMRECCDVLAISGETQARRIARCQVLLDKGLDMIRQMVRDKLPGITQAWQVDININSASRRELTHQLSLTEGEVERLIANRQYYMLKQLVERSVIKPNRLTELENKGAVAVFVPIDINSATVRDLIDILGLDKDKAQRIAATRPFEHFNQLLIKKIIDQPTLEKILERGAVIKTKFNTEKRPDLNQVQSEELNSLGIPTNVTQRLIRGRPFTTWSELDEYLSCDTQTWALLRQNFCLSLTSD